LYRSIDGTCSLSDKQIIELAIKAYDLTGLIPSRRVWGANKHHASASGAIIKAFGDFPITNSDWLSGFDFGFENCTSDNYEILIEHLAVSREFQSGFKTGKVVAAAFFGTIQS
jgi:hypothetical protein